MLKQWGCVEEEGCYLKNTVAVGKRGQVIMESRGEGGVEGIHFWLSYSCAFIAEGFEGKCSCIHWSGLCFFNIGLGCVFCVCFWGHVCCRVCARGCAARAACERPAFHTTVPMPGVCGCILSNLLCMNECKDKLTQAYCWRNTSGVSTCGQGRATARYTSLSPIL